MIVNYLQRLTEVRLGSRTSSNKIAYGYDRWGNRTSSATKGTVTNFMACSTDCAVDATTNRISDWRYDAAGNPIGISTSTLQWDGAGRLESIDNGATASYSYDHLGRCILKRAPSDNTQYFYDVTGKVLWEFDPDGTGVTIRRWCAPTSTGGCSPPPATPRRGRTPSTPITWERRDSSCM